MSEKSRQAWGWIIACTALAFGACGATIAAYRSHQQAERRAAELAASTFREDALTEFLFNSPTGWAVLDDACLVRDWNPAMERMTGWTKEEMLGNDLSRIMQPATWKKHVAACERAMKDPVPWGIVQNVKCELLHKDETREPLTVHVRVQVLQGRKGMQSIAMTDPERMVVEIPDAADDSVLKHLVEGQP